MALFSIENTKLTFIEEDPFKLEKDIQVITEENLNTIFSLQFVVLNFQ